MIKGVYGQIESYHSFKIKKITYIDDVLVPQPEHTIDPSMIIEPLTDIEPGYIRLKSCKPCYVTDCMFDYKLMEESDEIIIKWFRFDFTELKEHRMLYTVDFITSNHEIVELEIL